MNGGGASDEFFALTGWIAAGRRTGVVERGLEIRQHTVGGGAAAAHRLGVVAVEARDVGRSAGARAPEGHFEK